MSTAQRDPVLRYLRKLVAHHDDQQRSDGQLLDDFIVRRQEAAFATLVTRHGPMVLRVCRRVLGHEQDAEDAFQATFLVLVRGSRAIRKREALADWLHGVAFRTAMKAKRSAARRRRHELHKPDAPAKGPQEPFAAASSMCPSASLTWAEVQAVLDEELRKLSEPFRQAFVLCVLEGKTEPEAAALLRCRVGTVSSRLARARQQLQRRLTRRGIHLGALLAALALADNGSKALAATLARTTIHYGILAAAGAKAASQIPAHISALAQGVSAVMYPTSVKVATAVLLTASLLVAGAAVVAQQAATADPAPGQKPAAQTRETMPAAPAQPTQGKASQVDVRGKVVDPQGKPVPAARLLFDYFSADRTPDKTWALSSSDGTFHFSLPKQEIEEAAGLETPWKFTYIMATAEGHGFAWAPLRPETAGDVTLRLVPDDVPLQGRVLDLQGKPVANVTVRVDGGIEVPNQDTLEEWIKTRRVKKDGGNHFTTLKTIASKFPVVKTDADGHFLMNGIGRDRIITLRLEGPTIATQRIKAMTRKGDTIAAVHGATFDVVVMPTRPIVGVVRDKDTGKPLAGVVVRSHTIAGVLDFGGLVRTTTDKDGRYRLVGLPKGEKHQITAEARGYQPRADDLPYFSAVHKVPNVPGLEPITMDFALKRGIWIKGRVIDRATDKSVRAGIEYYCFGDNPSADQIPIPDGVPSNWTRRDGTFQVLAVPGRSLIAVRAQKDQYRMAVGADRIKGERVDGGQLWDTRPFHLYPGNYHTIAEASANAGDDTVQCDIYLERGQTLTGVALAPDGTPLTDLEVSGARPMTYWKHVDTHGDPFPIYALDQHKARLLQVVHQGKKLAGYHVLRTGEKAPIRVHLQPWGTFTGRLVTPTGEPVTQTSIHLGCRADQDVPGSGAWGSAHPDKEGKFRITGLAPGLRYNLHMTRDAYVLQISGQNIEDLSIRPGETKDLGAIQVKPMD